MIGQTISHYRILEELGGGGMGVVYKAEDTKLKRTVALKFLPPELTRDKDAKTRFIHEAQAASALQHHNICTIHEIDETDDGRMFISMDCYEGETLKERIAGGPLPVEEALDIACQVAEGLAKAHKAGMVHRDIKPANIMITGDGVVKILDFGLAKLAGQTRVTKTGTTVGTVAYMSPEQARGEAVGAQSDVFSLGCVLYELLTGQLPFQGDHEAAVMYGIMHSNPKPMVEYRGDIPDGIHRIVETALSKDPGKRYKNAAEMAESLSAFGRRKPLRSSARFALRWPLVLGLVLVGVVVGIGVWLILPTVNNEIGPEEMALAVVDFQDLATPDNLITAKGMAGLLHVGFVESCPIRVVSPEYLQDLRRRRFGDAHGPIEESQALEIARQSGATYLLTGQIATLGASRYVTWRLVDTRQGRSLAARRVDGDNLADLSDRIVADVLPVIHEIAKIEVPAKIPLVGDITTNFPEAYEHYVAGLSAMEIETWAAAAQEFKKAVKIDSSFALAYYQLSRLSSGWGRGADDPKPARNYADQAWDFRSKLGIKDRLQLEAWRQLLDARNKDALETYREMIARWPNDRTLLNSYAEGLFDSGLFDEGVTFSNQAMILYPDEPRFIWLHTNSLGYLGRFEEALEAARMLVRKTPAITGAWVELGQRFLEIGLPDSAEVAMRQALDISPDNIYPQRYISYCAYYRGDVNQAIELQNRILARGDLMPGDRNRLLSGHPATPDLPQLHAEKGHFKQALDIIEEARQNAKDHEAEILIESNRNRWLLRMGQADEVARWAQDLIDDSDWARLPRFAPVFNLGSAQVAVDSLEAAKITVAKLHDLAEQTGARQIRVRALKVTAEIALAEGDPEAALSALHEMDRLGIYRTAGLDNIEWRECMSRAHYMAGRLDDAARVHEEMLRTFRGHTLSHYELGKIYEEMGRKADAAYQYRAFLTAWSSADAGLPQVEDAKKRSAALKQAIQ